MEQPVGVSGQAVNTWVQQLVGWSLERQSKRTETGTRLYREEFGGRRPGGTAGSGDEQGWRGRGRGRGAPKGKAKAGAQSGATGSGN